MNDDKELTAINQEASSSVELAHHTCDFGDCVQAFRKAGFDIEEHRPIKSRPDSPARETSVPGVEDTRILRPAKCRRGNWEILVIFEEGGPNATITVVRPPKCDSEELYLWADVLATLRENGWTWLKRW